MKQTDGGKKGGDFFEISGTEPGDNMLYFPFCGKRKVQK